MALALGVQTTEMISPSIRQNDWNRDSSPRLLGRVRAAPSKAWAASSKPIPCFRRLAAALSGAHSKSSINALA